MIDYGKQSSAVKPEEMEITSSKVFIYSDITEVSVVATENEDAHIMYEFNLVEYDKDEYISLMSTKNSTMENELTSTQIALCEVYEMLG